MRTRQIPGAVPPTFSHPRHHSSGSCANECPCMGTCAMYFRLADANYPHGIKNPRFDPAGEVKPQNGIKNP